MHFPPKWAQGRIQKLLLSVKSRLLRHPLRAMVNNNYLSCFSPVKVPTSVFKKDSTCPEAYNLKRQDKGKIDGAAGRGDK